MFLPSSANIFSVIATFICTFIIWMPHDTHFILIFITKIKTHTILNWRDWVSVLLVFNIFPCLRLRLVAITFEQVLRQVTAMARHLRVLFLRSAVRATTSRCVGISTRTRAPVDGSGSEVASATATTLRRKTRASPRVSASPTKTSTTSTSTPTSTKTRIATTMTSAIRAMTSSLMEVMSCVRTTPAWKVGWLDVEGSAVDVLVSSMSHSRLFVFTSLCLKYFYVYIVILNIALCHSVCITCTFKSSLEIPMM